MSAFAMFILTSPSPLAFDKERTAGNLGPLYGIQRVPCDTHTREVLNAVSPAVLRPLFKSVLRQLQRSKALQRRKFKQYFYASACAAPPEHPSGTRQQPLLAHSEWSDGRVCKGKPHVNSGNL